jgi:hypothetical protein
MLSIIISIEFILYILFLEKYFFLNFNQYSPYLYSAHRSDKLRRKVERHY